MRKIIFFIAILLIFFATHGQIRCPYGGLVDCRGQCGLYIDDDGDGFCDYGKLSKNMETKKDSIASQTTQPAPNNPQPAAAAKQSHTQPSTPQESIENTTQSVGNDTIAELVTPAQAEANTAADPPLRKPPYHLFEIAILSLAFYLFSALLAKYKVYSVANHRKFWNTGLAVSFLVSCLLGLLLAWCINRGVFPQSYKTWLFLHVEFGIAMTMIGVFHLIWHWRYYLRLFKKKKNKASIQ